MTVETLVAAQVTERWAGHGEGPVWDAGAGMLRWVDMHRGDILSWRPGDSSPIRWHVGEVAAALRRRRSGGFAVATARGYSMLSDDGEVIEELPDIWQDHALRMNDGGCDRAGRFYCGSMAYDEATGAGTLYRLDPDHQVTPVLDDLTIPNGLGFSADGGFAFHIDTPTHQLLRHTITPDGCFVDPELVLTIPQEQGSPDGMSLDAEGGFWIAMWDGHAVRHFDSEGQLRHIVRVPVARPTSCAFGGTDRRTLYITSSLDEDNPEPGAGAIFSVRTDVGGPAEEFFAG